jgi:hypothetical protein
MFAAKTDRVPLYTTIAMLCGAVALQKERADPFLWVFALWSVLWLSAGVVALFRSLKEERT